MNLLKSVYSLLISKIAILLFLVLTLAYHIHYRFTIGNSVEQLVYLYGNIKYDINKLPNGIIIYKSSEPILDDNTKLYYYEVGIWDYSVDEVIYVRVPQYAHNRFVLGVHLRQIIEQQENDDSESGKMKYDSPTIYL